MFILCELLLKWNDFRWKLGYSPVLEFLLEGTVWMFNKFWKFSVCIIFSIMHIVNAFLLFLRCASGNLKNSSCLDRLLSLSMSRWLVPGRLESIFHPIVRRIKTVQNTTNYKLRLDRVSPLAYSCIKARYTLAYNFFKLIFFRKKKELVNTKIRCLWYRELICQYLLILHGNNYRGNSK